MAARQTASPQSSKQESSSSSSQSPVSRGRNFADLHPAFCDATPEASKRVAGFRPCTYAMIRSYTSGLKDPQIIDRGYPKSKRSSAADRNHNAEHKERCGRPRTHRNSWSNRAVSLAPIPYPRVNLTAVSVVPKLDLNRRRCSRIAPNVFLLQGRIDGLLGLGYTRPPDWSALTPIYGHFRCSR